MKKAISIILFSIFLFNTAGYFIAFKALQYQVKNEIESQIKSGLTIEQLTNITIDKKDIGAIEWEESGKEMVYRNERYDIVKTTETATSITYVCINDKKEETLFANLDEHVNTHVANAPLKNSHQKKLADHVIKLYFSSEQLIAFHTTQLPSAFFLTSINYTPAFIETNSPPPEFV
jgi:hypothetical protein